MVNTRRSPRKKPRDVDSTPQHRGVSSSNSAPKRAQNMSTTPKGSIRLQSASNSKATPSSTLSDRPPTPRFPPSKRGLTRAGLSSPRTPVRRNGTVDVHPCGWKGCSFRGEYHDLGTHVIENHLTPRRAGNYLCHWCNELSSAFNTTTDLWEHILDNHLAVLRRQSLEKIQVNPKSTQDPKATHNHEGKEKIGCMDCGIPASKLDGDSRECPQTGEVWYADFPPFFMFGETPFAAKKESEKIEEDLARGAREMAGEIESEPEPLEASLLSQPSGIWNYISSIFGGKAAKGNSTEPKAELSYWERHQADWRLPKAAEAVMNDVTRSSYLQGGDIKISAQKRKRNDEGDEDNHAHSAMRSVKVPKRRVRSVVSESSSPPSSK